MKFNKKASYAMTEEIALTDSELETVFGGQGWGCPPPPPPLCSGGAPSYGGGYPSYGSGYGSPSYGGGYPSYGSGYGSPSYGGGYSGGGAPSYTTITYSVIIPANSSSPCNNGGY